MNRVAASSGHRLAIGVACMLLSTLGVLLAGGVGLWRAARDARALSESAREQAVLSAARALQSWFAAPDRLLLADNDPDLLELADARPIAPAAVAP